MAFPEHTHRSSFFWDSKLSDERKDEIIAWVASLGNAEVQMLNDITQDVREDIESEGCPYCDG